MKAHNDLQNSEVIIDIPDENNALKNQMQIPKQSNPKKSFTELTDIELKMRMFEQQIIEEGIQRERKQNQQNDQKKTVLQRLSTQQYKNNQNQDDIKQRERELSLQQAENIMKQFKNRVDKKAEDLSVDKQNICYQQYDKIFENKEKKVLFLKIKVLEMQLNLQRAEDYIEKYLPVSTASREYLIDNLIEYLLQEEQKQVNMRKSLPKSKKKTVVKNNQLLFQGLANVNLAISQEISDCTPKTALLKQNAIVPCTICYQDVLGSQSIKMSSQCNHSFCISCLEQYITFKIQEGRCTHIYCPQLNCKCVFTDKEIQKLLSKTLFQNYLKIKKHSIINRDPQIRYCQKGACDSYIKFAPGTLVDSCQYCSSKVCFECYMPSHKGSKKFSFDFKTKPSKQINSLLLVLQFLIVIKIVNL